MIVDEEVEFQPDLYRGTAGYYDRFRVGYPQAMMDDLLDRAQPSGHGRLLDLACGTGQITFAMCPHFAEVWAVDREREMIEVVREKAALAAAAHIRGLVSDAEDVVFQAQSLELVAIGNAFHRLRRETVALNALRWLAPGRYVALLWASSPWVGEESWQQALSATLDRWMTRVGADRRVPAGLDQARKNRPDETVLVEAGFEPVGSHRFGIGHDWTAEALIGFVYSTSVLSRPVLGELADTFESDIHQEMSRYELLREEVDFAYQLARRPA